MINTVLLILSGLFFFLKNVDFIYLFQTKEYRLDRFFSHLKENNWLNIFYFQRIKLPAKSPRNLLIFLFSLPFFLVYFFLINQLSVLIKVIVFIITPFLAFIVIYILVKLTDILAFISRKIVILKAVTKIKKSQVRFIGITGSSGKTTTKEFLYTILSKKFKVEKTEANKNTPVGIALSILKNLKNDTEYFIVEMGAYKIGEIAEICQLTPPSYAILTNIGNQHLSLFGSKTNLLSTKTELLKAVPKIGKIYVNIDSYPIIDFQKEIQGEIISFSSTKNDSDVFINELKNTQSKIETIITYKKNVLTMTAQLIGQHNIINLLPCIALALDLNIPSATIIKTIEKITNVVGKLSLHKGPKSSLIVNDSNNSNVEGFISSINTLNSFPQKNKLIISKGIIELGAEKKTSYKKIVDQLNQTIIRLFTTDPLFKTYDKNHQVEIFKDESALLNGIGKYLDSDSLILIEGRFTKNLINRLIRIT